MKSSSYLLFRFVPYSILKVLKQSIMQGYFQVSFVPYSIFEVLKRVVAARSFDFGFVPYNIFKVLKHVGENVNSNYGLVPYDILKVLKHTTKPPEKLCFVPYSILKVLKRRATNSSYVVVLHPSNSPSFSNLQENLNAYSTQNKPSRFLRAKPYSYELYHDKTFWSISSLPPQLLLTHPLLSRQIHPTSQAKSNPLASPDHPLQPIHSAANFPHPFKPNNLSKPSSSSPPTPSRSPKTNPAHHISQS